MIVATKTIDNKGRVYDHLFSNFNQDAVVCINGLNSSFDIRPNISIRKGVGKYGEQLILQFVIDKKIEEYKAVSKLDHIETYFKLNKETLEFFERIVKLLKQEVSE